MWLAQCAWQLGMEQTNRLNLAAVKGMAVIEVKRLAKLLGVTRIKDFETLKEFVDHSWGILVGDFMDFTYQFQEPNIMRADMKDCFAYRGTKRLGVIDQYQCGIFERINGWWEGLGLEYAVTPQVTGCMMHQEGRCFRKYTILGYPA
jgi:hypothetical protein